jgi:hypothetical protein
LLFQPFGALKSQFFIGKTAGAHNSTLPTHELNLLLQKFKKIIKGRCVGTLLATDKK